MNHSTFQRTIPIFNSPDLIIFRWARIKRPAQEKLSHDTAQRPHVNRLAERQSKNDFGCAIVARLQVCVAHRFAHVRCTAEVDNFHSARKSMKNVSSAIANFSSLNFYLYGWRTGSTSMIFSGFRSAWIRPSCFSFNKAVRTWAMREQWARIQLKMYWNGKMCNFVAAAEKKKSQWAEIWITWTRIDRNQCLMTLEVTTLLEDIKAKLFSKLLLNLY